MVGIMLGNLKIEDIEKDLRIRFNDEDRDYLRRTRQENVSINLEKDAWHFFDIPRRICFGSLSACNRFKDMISKYDVKGVIEMEFTLTDDVKPSNLYDLKTEDGWPRFLIVTSKYLLCDSYIKYQFYQLVKVNRKSLVYRSIKLKTLEKDVLKLNEMFFHETMLPDEDNFVFDDFLKISKDVILNSDNVDKIVHAGYQRYSNDDVEYAEIWSGEKYMTYDWKKMSKDDFDKIISEHKLKLKRIRQSSKGGN